MIAPTVGAASQEAVVALVEVFIRGYDAGVATYTLGQYPIPQTV
mgnify:FL=1